VKEIYSSCATYFPNDTLASQMHSSGCKSNG
jgi:hypothetical protein